MSVATATRPESTAAAWSMAWITQRISGAALHVAVIGLTIVWIVPTVGLLLSSFRPFADIATTGWWTALSPPYHFTLQNYTDVLDPATSNLATAFFNSFMVAIPSTVIPVTIAAFAAYAFAWMKFPGRDWIFLAFVGLLAVPLQLTFIPVLKFFVDHGIVPQNLSNLGIPPWLGLWLAHAGYGLPFSTYLLANFFRALPSDLFESAEIDGAGTLTVFFRIILPLSVPALASLVIFQFLWVWNDLLVALIYVGGAPEVAPLTVNLANLTNSYGQGYQLLTAAAFFSMIVPLVVFLSLQRYFVRGILAGSVKG
jgi:alpha-glucoside transport system permease protein